MSEVRRYDNDDGLMIRDSYGKWVDFIDHEMVAAELRAEIEALVEDAGRYRWLRSHAGKDDREVEVFIGNESWAPGNLDAQIDAAMKEQAE